MEDKTKSTPEILSKISPNLENLLAFFKNEAESPTSTMITPCPNAKRNNINAAYGIFLESTAKLIMPAKIGVEHGVVASAKSAPIKSGYKNRLLPFDFGIFFTITGIGSSSTPSKFKPITKIKDEINKTK